MAEIHRYNKAQSVETQMADGRQLIGETQSEDFDNQKTEARSGPRSQPVTELAVPSSSRCMNMPW